MRGIINRVNLIAQPEGKVHHGHTDDGRSMRGRTLEWDGEGQREYPVTGHEKTGETSKVD